MSAFHSTVTYWPGNPHAARKRGYHVYLRVSIWFAAGFIVVDGDPHLTGLLLKGMVILWKRFTVAAWRCSSVCEADIVVVAQRNVEGVR